MMRFFFSSIKINYPFLYSVLPNEKTLFLNSFVNILESVVDEAIIVFLLLQST